MEDDVVQKCIDNPQQFDYYLCSIIPIVGHKVHFVSEFIKTRGNEGEPTSSSSSSSKMASTSFPGRIQQPNVYVNAWLNKVKMEIDYIPVKAEPEEVENNDEEEEPEERIFSVNQMARLESSQNPHVCNTTTLEKFKIKVDDVSVEAEPEPEEVENNIDREPEIGNSSSPISKPKNFFHKINQKIADILQQQEKYGEALEILQQVSAQQNEIHGENQSHPENLNTQNMMASLHSKLCDFPKALTLYEDLEKKQTEILGFGPDHRELLQTKHKKAVVLYEMGKFQEASKIFKEVHEKKKEILGENHPETIDTLSWIAEVLEREGKFKEALQIHKKINQSRKTRLGENHLDSEK